MISIEELIGLGKQGSPFVLVTIIEVSGSAPREVGARMGVTLDSTAGSIGGGNLEYHAIQRARELLSDSKSSSRFDEFFGLGVAMNQCCGGAVRLLYERLNNAFFPQLKNINNVSNMVLASPVKASPESRSLLIRVGHENYPAPAGLADELDALMRSDTVLCKLVELEHESWFLNRLDEYVLDIVLFGAGHVGKALVKALCDLPFHVHWVDERVELFPDNIPDNVSVHHVANPLDYLQSIDPDGVYLVMTHNHGLDYEICYRILQQRDFHWLGLIGSATKRLRFEKRLKDNGIHRFALNRLVCPIGVERIRGKSPAVIAASIAAQLLQVREQIQSERENVTEPAVSEQSLHSTDR